MPLELKKLEFNNPNPENNYVTYENKLSTRFDFSSKELEILFRNHEKEIMQIVEEQIAEYVNCDDTCNDDEDMFPRRCELNGEWYVRGITFDEIDFLSVLTAFISENQGYKDDYLGLEVVFFYDEDSQKFEIDGINSECI